MQRRLRLMWRRKQPELQGCQPRCNNGHLSHGAAWLVTFCLQKSSDLGLQQYHQRLTKTGSATYSRDCYHVNALVKANSCNRLSVADFLWGNPSHSATSCTVTACSRATCLCLLREARAACGQQAVLLLQKHLAAAAGSLWHVLHELLLVPATGSMCCLRAAATTGAPC